MRALFVGGVVDNSEMDLDDTPPPMHYPENTGAGRPRYRLHQIGERGDGTVAYAVYGARKWPMRILLALPKSAAMRGASVPRRRHPLRKL